jgi:3'-phosphoadenosine 5'-phosphosulfate sulfotransferase (PAPS reductase)/FAD synthetase
MNTISPLDRHDRIALSFSGGKDSTACVYLLKDRLADITVYHVDAGDLLPDMREHVERVEAIAPRFVRINTDSLAWIAANGMPSDLVPYASHPFGQLMGEGKTKLVSRYDCCFANLMWPLFKRVVDDGNTLLIRGTKRADMLKFPVSSGDVDWAVNLEFYYPLEGWTNEQVFNFLALQKVKLPGIYLQQESGPDCARCTGWWNEGRAAYLKQYYPELWADYDARLQKVIDEIAGPLMMLRREAGVA